MLFSFLKKYQPGLCSSFGIPIPDGSLCISEGVDLAGIIQL